MTADPEALREQHLAAIEHEIASARERLDAARELLGPDAPRRAEVAAAVADVTVKWLEAKRDRLQAGGTFNEAEAHRLGVAWPIFSLTLQHGSGSVRFVRRPAAVACLFVAAVATAGASATTTQAKRHAATTGHAHGLVDLRAAQAPFRTLSPIRAAANSVTFQDSIGEDPAAPDITTLVVSNDDSRTLTFRINIPNRPALTPDMLLSLFADTDFNPATGDPNSRGSDYVIELFQGQIYLFRWDGSNFTRRSGDPPATSLVFAYQGGVTIRISAVELGNTQQFAFAVLATSGVVVDSLGNLDFTNAHSDLAPDSGLGFYAYRVLISQPPPPKPPPKPPKPKPEKFSVRSVYDGDTLTLANGKRIRLLQIDTPELGSGECYSRVSRTVLVSLVPIGSRVSLESDPRLDKVDRYGRLLRYVHRGSLHVNLQLVKRGAAAPYFYRGDRGKYAARLLSEARSARAARRGLWKACPKTRLDPDRAIETGTSGPPSTKPPPNGKCDPNYKGACVPPPPPDLDCADLRALGLNLPVRVVGSDPHRLDGDGDGLGCETGSGGKPKPRPAPGKCDPNYRGACIPIVPYDLDCADIDGPVYVVGVDIHRFDGDGDGVGCE